MTRNLLDGPIPVKPPPAVYGRSYHLAVLFNVGLAARQADQGDVYRSRDGSLEKAGELSQTAVSGLCIG